jgi:hypothetical protein
MCCYCCARSHHSRREAGREWLERELRAAHAAAKGATRTLSSQRLDAIAQFIRTASSASHASQIHWSVHRAPSAVTAAAASRSDLQSCRAPVHRWSGSRLVEARARRHRWMQTDSRRITHSINRCIRHAQIRLLMPPHTRLRPCLVPLQLLLPALLRPPLSLLRVLRPHHRLCFPYHRRATPVRP